MEKSMDRIFPLALCAVLGFALTACAGVSPPRADDVPGQLAPGPNAAFALVAAARGVQIYQCRETAGAPGTYAWAFVAPEADLFDAGGQKIGRHFAGPQWEARDGSAIVGTVRERVDAPQADAIPWLLLSAKSVGPEGTFSRIASVQRVHTVGGAAPRQGCTQSAAGTTERVPYTADYYFWTATSRSSSY